MTLKVLLTGSTGFIGKALLSKLIRENFYVRAVVRSNNNNLPSNSIEIINLGEFTPSTNWSAVLQDIDVVVHLASRVHIMRDDAKNPLAEYRYINVDTSLNLANQSAKSKVKRFIYLSSIKVNGEVTQPGKAFSADDTPQPQDAYGISKYEAELGLKKIALDTGMDVVIVRPPLVYGPGVKANFLNMMSWLARSIPLPLGSINNLRSFVALDNLVDLIVKCIDHPKAVNHVFLVSDDEDLSTTSLLYRLGNALEKPAFLISVPYLFLRILSALSGTKDSLVRISSSLRIDISKTREVLDWSPPISVDEGLRLVAEDFKRNEKNF